MNLQQLASLDVTKIDLSKLAQRDLVALQKMLTPKMTKFSKNTPTPKQTAFLLLNGKEAFYGGAAGGGKSDALLMAGLQYVDIKGYSGILFRKSYADLSKPGALINRSKEWLMPWVEQKECKWNEKERRWEFLDWYGRHVEVRSTLQFGYLENASDKYNYQGGEYQFIGFDELTHISEDNYLYMFSRLRRLLDAPVPLRVRGASNPPNDDQGIWVKKRFIDEGPEKGRVFISAGLDDNPFLDKASYEESLDELDPVTRMRLRFGDWDIIRKGNMFKRAWFRVVDHLPSMRAKVRFWDMAASDEEASAKKNKSNEPDYTVGFLLGLDYKGQFYICDIIHGRWGPKQTQEIQHMTARQDGRGVIIREEIEPGSAGMTLTDMKSRTLFKGYDYAGERPTGSKATRAAAASAYAEKGNIMVLSGCRNIEAFFNEAESFPGGIHDDLVDGLSGALNYLASQITTTGTPETLDRVYGRNSWHSQIDYEPGWLSRINE